MTEKTEKATNAENEPKKIENLIPPEVPKDKQTVLFIQGLDRRVNEHHIYTTFQEYNINYMKIAKDPITRVSLGYGFLAFRSRTKAEQALENLNHIRLLNKTITLTWFNRGYDTYREKPGLNIFVKNIPKTMKTEEFEEFYGKFGEIISARIVEGADGLSRGYGFVLYKLPESAQNAIKETNGIKLKDGKKNLVVCWFEKNRKKNPLKFNNIYVKNIPLNWTDDDVRNYFAKFGEISSMIVKLPDVTKLKPTIPERKRKEILEHKFAFICYNTLDGPAEKAVAQVPYLKLNDKEYNEKIEHYVGIFRLKDVKEDDLYKCACYVLDHKLEEEVKTSKGLEKVTKKFVEMMEDDEGYYYILDKSDRLYCCRALKKKDRERKAAETFIKIKRRLREKYKFCNLYVKNLPDEVTAKDVSFAFAKYGYVKSCALIRRDPGPVVFNPLNLTKKVYNRVFAYVCFKEQKNAVKAKQKLNGKPIYEGAPKMYVDYHQPKEERLLFIKLQIMKKDNRLALEPQPSPEESKTIPQIGDMQPRTVRYLMELMKLMNQENLAKPRYGSIFPKSAKRDDIYRYKLYDRLCKFNDFYIYHNLFNDVINDLLVLSDYYLEKMLENKMFLYGQVALAIKNILYGKDKSPEEKVAEEKQKKENQKKEFMDVIDGIGGEKKDEENEEEDEDKDVNIIKSTMDIIDSAKGEEEKKDEENIEDKKVDGDKKDEEGIKEKGEYQIKDKEKQGDKKIDDKYNVLEALGIDKEEKNGEDSNEEESEDEKAKEDVKKGEDINTNDKNVVPDSNLGQDDDIDYNIDFDLFKSDKP